MQYEYEFSWWMNLASTLFAGHFLTTNFPQLFLNIIPGSSQVKVNIGIHALKNKTVSEIYNGKIYIRKKLLWVIPVNINITEKKVNSTTSMLPLDGAPGGFFNVSNLGLSIGNELKQNRFCFVPTVSSLALSNWEQNLTASLSGKDFFAEGISGFDQVYVQGNNQQHVTFDYWNAIFLNNHLAAPPLKFTETTLSFCASEKTVNIQNWKNTPITWSVSGGFSVLSSNNTSASIGPPIKAGQGILTVNSVVPIRKRINSTCDSMRVVIGILQTMLIPNNTIYTVKANRVLDVNGGSIKNAHIRALPQSKVLIRNQGNITIRKDGEFEMQPGATLDIQSGNIDYTP